MCVILFLLYDINVLFMNFQKKKKVVNFGKAQMKRLLGRVINCSRSRVVHNISHVSFF